MTADLQFTPIRELAELVRTRRVSPVELTKAALDRLDRMGGRLNAVVTITEQLARGQARRAEEEIGAGRYRGPLHGIPYGAKDLFVTASGNQGTPTVPTTWGAAPFRDQVFDYDATVVARLEQAGAVLCAKLAMVELAGGMGYTNPDASFTGPGKNPWDCDTWTGGSSSGSAAAVAAGMVPFSIGTETWGSIIMPAASCGVSGLRPTYGRVSRFGAMAAAWSLDKIGPFYTTADDCGLVLEAIAGPDDRDDSSIDAEWRYRPKGRSSARPRLAYLKGAADTVEPHVGANFLQALETFEGDADIEEVTLPDLPYEAVIRTVMNAETAAAFDEFIESGGGRGLTAPSSRTGVYARTVVLAVDYLKAQRIRRLIDRAADDLLSRYDALVGPSWPGTAYPIDRDFDSAITGDRQDVIGAVGNLSGLPSISVPNGFDPDGLPTGLQFLGRAGGENTILRLAKTYQSRTDWHNRHPRPH